MVQCYCSPNPDDVDDDEDVGDGNDGKIMRMMMTRRQHDRKLPHPHRIEVQIFVGWKSIFSHLVRAKLSLIFPFNMFI